MKIGFDISQTGAGKAGCGYFADSIICHLAKLDQKNQYFLYSTFGDHYWDDNNRKVRQISLPNFQRGLKHNSREEADEFWQNPPVNFESQLGSPDIIHANNFFCPLELKASKLLYTLYDINFLKNPEWSTAENCFACFNGVFKASIYADSIISISQYSLNSFLNTFPHFSPKKAEIIYPASRFSYKEEIPQPKKIAFLKKDNFWLCAGTIEPRKNHKKLLHAYKKLKEKQGRVMPLILAGGKGWLMDDITQVIENLNLTKDVKMVGYVNDDELQWLYQNCFCSLYPSLFEGFGLPVLEAMSLKAPVITSNVSSIPEIVGDEGIMVDPQSEEELFNAMLRITKDNDCRMDLKERGFNRAKKFSWELAAAKLLSVYEKLVL